MGAAVDPEGSKGPVRRVALVIGNGAYRTLTELRNSRNDAQDMCAALGRLGFSTTCVQDVPTQSELRRTLLQFSTQLDPRSVAFFYYAGHGVQVNGRNYLLPTTINPATTVDLERGGVTLDEVFVVLKEARAQLNIVVLDACRDDPFSDGRGPQVSRGLAREDPPPGSVLVYATAPGAAAADGMSRNGLFTTHLLAEIEKPGPQIGEMLRGVARHVEQEARSRYSHEQIPYRSFSYSGVFCFAACDDTKIAEQVGALQLQRESALRRIQELEAQNAALERARDPSTGTTRPADNDRTTEIRSLRQQLEALGNKSRELEAYRKRIADLEQEARERDQRLTEDVRREERRRSRPTGVPTF